MLCGFIELCMNKEPRFKEEWAKLPPQQCYRLIKSYRKHLLIVRAIKVDLKLMNYEPRHVGLVIFYSLSGFLQDLIEN